MAASPWLAEGWFRNHFEGTLHRKDGEFHRGPERGGGWSDRNLSLMLLDYVNIEGNDPTRAVRIHRATTRPDLLKLAAEWNVPYISQLEWERSVDTDQNWFQVEPISRCYISPYFSKTIFVIAKITDIPYLSGNYKLPGKFYASIINGENTFIEGRWDWEFSTTSCSNIFGSPTTDQVINIRPRIAPHGVTMYHHDGHKSGNSSNLPQENTIEAEIGIEFLSVCKLIEVRDLIKLIEELWNIRRHDFKLVLRSDRHLKNQNQDQTTTNNSINYFEKEQEGASTSRILSPLDRFVDLDSKAAVNNELSLRLIPFQKNDNDENNEKELFILKFLFDQIAEYETHCVSKILWKEQIEGASQQVAVAAEMENVYKLINQPIKMTVEYVYALIDVCSGKVISSFTNLKSGSKSSSYRPMLPSSTESNTIEEEGEENKRDLEDVALSPSRLKRDKIFVNKAGADEEPMPFSHVRDSLLYSR